MILQKEYFLMGPVGQILVFFWGLQIEHSDWGRGEDQVYCVLDIGTLPFFIVAQILLDAKEGLYSNLLEN